MTDRTTRRDLMRPVQLLAIAFVLAIFAGGITAISAGGMQTINRLGQVRPPADIAQAWVLGGIVAGITFIVVLLMVSMLLLAIDPNQVSKPVGRPVLLPEGEQPAASAGESADADDARPDAATD